MMKKDHWRAFLLTIAFWVVVTAIYKANVRETREENLRQGQVEAARRAEEQEQKQKREDLKKIDDAFASWEKAYEQLRASKQNMENTADILMRKASDGLCDEVVGTTTVNHSAQFIWKKIRAVFHPSGANGGGQRCIGDYEYHFYVRCYDSRWETHWNKAKSKDLLPDFESHLFFTPLKDVDLKLFACVEPEIPYADEKLQRANEMGKEIRIQ